MRELKEFNPVAYREYLIKNPFDQVLVDTYNRDVNSRLRDLRQKANDIRGNDVFNDEPGFRKDLLKINILQQNLVKRNLLDKYEAYDVKP